MKPAAMADGTRARRPATAPRPALRATAPATLTTGFVPPRPSLGRSRTERGQSLQRTIRGAVAGSPPAADPVRGIGRPTGDGCAVFAGAAGSERTVAPTLSVGQAGIRARASPANRDNRGSESAAATASAARAAAAAGPIFPSAQQARCRTSMAFPGARQASRVETAELAASPPLPRSVTAQ